ncbi:MAG: T9SS type A sorting domain-containing protein, partial [Fibrobacter sp.]|nr:T9SS type A sorting domain-containing protein [Fibrobacter sp.]
GSLKINPAKFPSGFKYIADYIHGKGLKAGFYSDGGDWTCGAVHGGERTGEGVGLYQHEQQDLDLALKTWGFDYIKVDYCGGSRHLHLDEQTQYTKIRKAIDNTGRDDVIYNVCRCQFPGAWVCSIGNSWRIADDINASWGSIIRILDLNTYLSGFSSPGHYNDMDMLEVGHGLPQVEDESHFALWCILSSPLVLGNDLTRMSSATLNLLKNKEAIAVNQDTSGLQAILISDDGNGSQVWGRRLNSLSSNERAVVLFNRSTAARTIKVRWKDLDLEGAATVRDILNKKDLGSFENEFSSSVPSHGVVFVKIVGSKSKLQEVFEAENSWMNNFNLTVNNQIVANQAKPAKDATCSGGAKVGYLGKSASNYIEFNKIWAAADGKYTMTLVYMCGENRSATMSVNGKDTVLNNLNSGSFTKRDSVVIPVNLKAGLNAIRFSNSSGYLPDMDVLKINVNSIVTGVSSPWVALNEANNLNTQIKDGILVIRNIDDNINVRVYDVSGRVVLSTDKKVFSIHNLKPGTYFLKVTASGHNVVKQFIKQ